VTSVGLVRNNAARYGDSVRPALFLIPSIETSGGNGSSTDPFELSMP